MPVPSSTPRRLSLVVLFALLFRPADAADQPLEFRVHVVIKADPGLSNQVQSFLTRELRSLPDVVVTDENPFWQIEVVALELGSHAGYALSVVTSELVDEQTLSDILRSTLGASEKAAVFAKKWASGTVRIDSHGLRLIPAEGLKHACQAIVADFDSEELEPVRKGAPKVREEMLRRVPNGK